MKHIGGAVLYFLVNVIQIIRKCLGDGSRQLLPLSKWFRVCGSDFRVNPTLKRQSTPQRAQCSVSSTRLGTGPSPRYFKLIFFLLIPCTLYLIPATLPAAYAADLTLAWDPNTESGIAGYKTYWGPSSGNYTASKDVGNTTSTTITGLDEGNTYYIAVTAYNGDGNESDFSEEVVHTIAAQNRQPNRPTVPSGPSSGYPNTGYDFTTSASDPDSDLLDYRFDWGDGTVSAWGGASSRTHSWSSTGNFCVKAQAQDPAAATSEWSQCHTINIAVSAYSITASAGAHGTISPSGNVTVNDGANQSFTITPDQGYYVSNVLVGNASVGATTLYNFNNVTQDHTITASFALNNQVPNANAGADQTKSVSDTVTLDGSGSSDADGDSLTFSWSFFSKPGGSSATLSSTTAARPTFEVDASGSYVVQLTVYDGAANSKPDTVTISTAQDSDNDGVPDDQDAFPSDSTETIDTDGDGIGNNADTDDDNDKMPDAWENQYGFDPLIDDASDDSDGDGRSNLDEFYVGSDPVVHQDNFEPDAPALTTPVNQQVMELTPALETNQFSDPDPGDFHSATQWKIYRESDNACIFDITSEYSLTNLEVPKLILNANADYIWQARYYDNHGTPSVWSETGSFSTAADPDDTDSNGIPDEQEVATPSDLDGDGTLDSDQDTIKCVTTGDGKALGLSFDGSGNVDEIEFISAENEDGAQMIASAAGSPEYFPFGLINFKLRMNQPGDQAVITVYFSEPAPAGGRWFKYDPIEATWTDYTAQVEISADRQSIILYLEDGGDGDADGTVNGIIVDPSGLAVSSSSVDSDGGSDGSSSSFSDSIPYVNGCFISTASSPDHQEKKAFHAHIWNEIRGRELAIALMLIVLLKGFAIIVKRGKQRWVEIQRQYEKYQEHGTRFTAKDLMSKG